ncbi:MAG: alpha/beta fold hydrolase [Acidobacteriota bacterium]
MLWTSLLALGGACLVPSVFQAAVPAAGARSNSSTPALAAARRFSLPRPREGDYIASDFRFQSGEVLHELRLHYMTFGQPVRDENGVVSNAVLVMHGTTGSGRGFLSETFAGGLFAPGRILDASRYYIILPDGVGHGRSSRPSDGLHMRFPRYTYDDMVRAQHLLLTRHLDVHHLRLVMGTSMGGMHTWVWGYTYPDFMDALMPLASLPVEIAGRNRMLRKMIIDSIKTDPEWRHGEYQAQPRGLRGAVHILIIMVSSPLYWQKIAPTRLEAEALLDERMNHYLPHLDATDMIYQFDASRNYNPAPHLEEIKAPLLAINSADDQVNPPELGILEKQIRRVRRGRAVVLPITGKTRGHGTHSIPAIWGEHLRRLLARSESAAMGSSFLP